MDRAALHRLAALVVQRARAPENLPQMKLSPPRAALGPEWLRADPCPVERGPSTVPWPLPSGFALRSRISDWSRICSSRPSIPVPFLAEISARGRSAELLEHHVVLQEVLLHLRHVGSREVDLVDRDDHRHARVAGVAVADRLRHDLVVGRHHQHDDVGDLRAARAHGGKGLMARGVEERDLAIARQGDVVRADVQGDASSLAGDDVGLRM